MEKNLLLIFLCRNDIDRVYVIMIVISEIEKIEYSVTARRYFPCSCGKVESFLIWVCMYYYLWRDLLFLLVGSIGI